MPRLTHAPLPTARNLVAPLFNHQLTDKELAAPWCCPGEQSFWFSLSAWSLQAIALWRQRLRRQPYIIVWLPDYFCNASLAPLREMGAQLQFYPTTKQMTPDLDACRNLVEESPPDLFVLVHFFGQPAEAEDIKAFCSATGAWLIEDAAQVLQPIPGVGIHGDCVLYSPHKLLPIPNGAVLVVRENGPAKLASQPSALRILQEVCRSILDYPSFSHLPAGIWLVKRLLQSLGVRNWRRSLTPFMMDADSISPKLEHPKMSPLARCLLPDLLNTLNTVASLRRYNKLLWDQALAKSQINLSEIRTKSQEYTPYLACFAFDNERCAEKVFLQWQKAGLPVTTWPDLPPEVTAQERRHRNAVLLRKTRLYLPVHQSLAFNQIKDYFEML